MKKILTAILMLIITVSAASAASYDISEHESLPLSGISRIVFELRSPNCALCISTDRLNYRFTGEQGGDSLNLSLEGNLKSNNKKAVPELITEKKQRNNHRQALPRAEPLLRADSVRLGIL